MGEYHERNHKINTIRDLEKWLKEWPDGLKDQPLNLTFFAEGRVFDHHYKTLYIYGDDGDLYIQNKDWDDGAS